MKSKRRSVNTDTKMCNKKIITRNMKNKIKEDKKITETITSDNILSSKVLPNTRGKINSAAKVDSDPYSFTKMDEECKIPLKKMKMTLKNEKNATVNTTNIMTMTEPELLGPCEPGSTIMLQGIVWLETNTGLLVINVTWKGRSYVGTLLDSNKYPFSTTIDCFDCQSKFEGRQTNGKRVQISPPRKTYHDALRSNTVRHSRRLSKSFSYNHDINKPFKKPTDDLNSCYLDSQSMSAEASCSGESDSEFTSCQKKPLINKTRSVTRSLAKRKLTIVGDSSFIEPIILKNIIECTQKNCYKKFTTATALRYHLHRNHGVFDDINVDSGINVDNKVSIMSSESSETKVNIITEDDTKATKGLNPKIKDENQKIEFIIKSKVEAKEISVIEKVPIGSTCVTEINVKSEDILKISDERSANVPFSIFSEINASKDAIAEKSIIINDLQNPEDAPEDCDPVIVNKIISAGKSSLENDHTQSNHNFHTVTAPTVYIPCESNTSVTNTSTLSSSVVSPSLMRPKPSQIPFNIGQNSQCKGQKPLKMVTQSNSNSNFQIPSSTIQTKKRPLVPIKVSVNSNHYRNLISSGASSSNPSSQHIRMPCSTVTPILPATSLVSSSSLNFSHCNISNGNNSNNGSLSCNVNSKRQPVTSNSTSPSALNSILSLKPIQPKPKVSNLISSYVNTTPVTTNAPISTPIIQGLQTNQTSYQRQILPSPVTKSDIAAYSDDRFVQKNPTDKSIKKKRRKPNKKTFYEWKTADEIKKIVNFQIQPKRDKELMSNGSLFSSSFDSYKMDEENSHSPEYSDQSETNDTLAPILEKEIELKSGDGDKLVICTDFDTSESSHSVNRQYSEHYDDNKESSIYNKPPALMPAVLSTDLLNGSTNEISLSDSVSTFERQKLPTNKMSSEDNIKNNDLLKVSDKTANGPSSLRRNFTSNRRSFQSPLIDGIPLSTLTSSSPSPSSISKVSFCNSSTNNIKLIDQNSKLKSSRKSSNLSAINDYVWMTKKNLDSKSRDFVRSDAEHNNMKSSIDDDCNKMKVLHLQSHQTNGMFSVHALTSPQDIASKSPCSTTEISPNPNKKSTNSLLKN